MTELRDHELLLPYPCSWVYKVIGESEAGVREAIAEVLQNRVHEVRLSRKSSGGRYCSFSVETTVYDERDRVGLYRALSGHALVRIVL